MKLTTIIMGVLIIGTLFIGLYSVTNDLSSTDKYNLDVTDYSGDFDFVTDISEDMNESYSEITEDWTSDRSKTIITFVVDATRITISIVKNSFKFFIGMIPSMMSLLGLPDWIQPFATGMLYTMIIFSLIAIALRYRYT